MTRNSRPSSQDLLLTSVYFYETPGWIKVLYMCIRANLSSSSSIFVVFGVIIELNCWISKHTKSYNFCSSTHLIQNALERFILITQSPEPPLKLQKRLRPPLCFKISIWFTCRVNSNQTDHQLRDWSGDKYLFFFLKLQTKSIFFIFQICVS